MLNVSASSELLVPKARSEPIVAMIGTAVIVIFLLLAVRNLLYRIAVIPSAVWVLLIAFVVIGNIRDSGWRACWVTAASAFARHQILVVNTSSDSSLLLVGFRLFGSNIVQRRIATSDVVGIRWDMGQASEMARRDVDDWSVILWYWHRDPEKEATQRRLGMRRPGQTPLVIGPARAKSVTEALARRTISFLDDCGVSVAVE